jgi:tRNA-dihydrouridine synthase
MIWIQWLKDSARDAVQDRSRRPGPLLAPMEGVTDALMLALMLEIGGFTFCVTEFVHVSNSVSGPRAC